MYLLGGFAEVWSGNEEHFSQLYLNHGDRSEQGRRPIVPASLCSFISGKPTLPLIATYRFIT